jgi:hypothetical protein
MELIYRLTRDEYRQGAKLALARVSHDLTSAAYLPRLVSLTLFVVVLIGCVINGLIDERALAAAMIAYLWAVYAAAISARFAQRRYWTILLPDDSPLLGDLHLKIGSDGVETPEAKYAWRAFSDISEYTGFIALWCGLSGILIPARAFTNEEARRDFVNRVRERIASAKTLAVT